jgi:Transcription factor WhiB
MRLSDVLYQVHEGSGDWRILSRCLQVGVEMVLGSGEDGTDEVNAGPAVQLCRTVCASCPVWRDCLAASEGQSGIWGGLTKDERGRLKFQSHELVPEARRIVKCEGCGYRCVPSLMTDPRCDDCVPVEMRPQPTELDKPRLRQLIRERMTYEEIGWVLGFSRDAVGEACREWGIKSRAGGNRDRSYRDPAMLAPCGTPAAVRRHHRRKEPIVSCACAQPGSSRPDRTMKNGWVA